MKYVILLLLLFLHTADLWRSFQKFNPFVLRTLVFPKTDVFNYLVKRAGIDRFWGYGFGTIEPNFSTQYSLFLPDGYDPLYPKRYGEFIQSSRDGKVKTDFTLQTRSDARITEGFGKIDLSNNTYRLRVLDMLGVKYILDRKENGSTEFTFLKERFRLAYDKEGWRIFENLKAAPRVFLADNYKVFKNNNEFEQLFFAKEFDPAKTILLEENPMKVDKPSGSTTNLSSSISGASLFASQKVKKLSYAPNKVVFYIQTKDTSLMFLSDTYYPGWRAFVDGRETKIYRANYAFRAVNVAAGKHTVVFAFKPNSFRVGISVSIISIILTGLALVIFTFKKREVWI